MSQAPTAAELLRSIGLDVDGPLRWGSRPTSRAAGIFVVETAVPGPTAPIDIDEVRRWLERVPDLRLDGERPTQTTLAARLATFWLPEQPVLYVGRTAKSLAARVSSLYATELGHSRPHPGGHWLKTLRDPSALRVWWAETDAPEEYEDELIEAFGAGVPDADRTGLPEGTPVLPWANLESPTGPPRRTGIAAALLSAEATPTPVASVRRSDRSASKRRAGATSGARAPRRTATRATPGNAAAASGPPREEPTHVTEDGLSAMHAELERLTSVERPQVVERVKHARELGDLRENADYEAARREQSFLEGRILELEHGIRTAVVITDARGGAISMGSTIVFEAHGERGRLRIVGSTESDPSNGMISAASPVGRALLGHRAGDVVTVTTPVARTEYRIIEVS